VEFGVTDPDAGVDAPDGGDPAVTSLYWPAEQSFPSFAPIAALDVVDVDGLPADKQRMLASLQGLINRTQPRIYLESGEAEGTTFWLDHISVPKNVVSDPLSLITKYATEIEGMEITDDAQVDTNNLATALAGVDNAIVVSPALAAQLSAAPYQVAVKNDLRMNHFTSKLDVYQWELDHVAPLTTARLMVGLNPAAALGPRDRAVAAQATTIWLNPDVPAEATLLNGFLGRLAPNSPYVGWWTDEQAGVLAGSQHSVPTFAADLFRNMTVLAGTSRVIHVPPAPLPPPLQNKIYVALFASDGDNMQMDQHLLTRKWNDPNRGKVPIGWTVSPGLVDAAPIILDHFWSTATPNDVMVAGASGLGYTYPQAWPGSTLDQYTERTGSYMAAGGLRAITVWTQGPISGPDLTGAVASSYANHLRRVLGLTVQVQTQPYAQLGGSLPAFRFVSSATTPGYAPDAASLEAGINTAMAGWAGTAPLFVAVQGNMNKPTMSPTALYNVQQNYASNPNVVFVRADHFFQLMREVQGLPVDPARDVRGPLCDFDGDGRADYADRSIIDGTIRVRLNPASGFADATSFTALRTSGDPFSNYATVIGDFDGDGKADYADHARSDGHLSVHLSYGNGFWTTVFEEGFTASGPNWQLLIGDFDGDGKADYADHGLPDGRLAVHLNTGTGFSPRVFEQTFTAYGADVETLIGDFDGDGKADYADHTLSTGQLMVHLNTGTGFATDVFEQGMTAPAGTSETLIGDFDGDGRADFADRNLITGVLSVHLNTGTGFSADTYEVTSTDVGPTLEVLGSSR
jgi:hypothetical protein